MPPTEVDVHQLAGRDHHGFGRRIKYLAEECVPWVEPVTGLTLPERLVIRLLDRTALRQTIMDHEDRLVAAALAEATGDHDVDKVIKANRAMASVSSRIASWVAGGITYTTAAGDPEIMITPDTWRHHGKYHDDDALMAMISHELIHPAQFHASEGRLPVMDTGPLGKDLGLADREINTVREGHATHFGARIATKVLGGNPVLWIKGRRYRRSLRYKLISGTISRLPMSKTAANTYNAGSWFTAHVLDGLGELPGLDKGVFNGLWARRDLFPDADEIRYPDTWLKRVTPELTPPPRLLNPADDKDPGRSTRRQRPVHRSDDITRPGTYLPPRAPAKGMPPGGAVRAVPRGAVRTPPRDTAAEERTSNSRAAARAHRRIPAPAEPRTRKNPCICKEHFFDDHRHPHRQPGRVTARRAGRPAADHRRSVRA